MSEARKKGRERNANCLFFPGKTLPSQGKLHPMGYSDPVGTSLCRKGEEYSDKVFPYEGEFLQMITLSEVGCRTRVPLNDLVN